MGARQAKDGPSATCYPTGVAAVPVEVLEAAMPIQFTQKRILPGSGGDGQARGGDGQIVGFKLRTDRPWLLNAVPSRLSSPAEGLEVFARTGIEHLALGHFVVSKESAASTPHGSAA